MENKYQVGQEVYAKVAPEFKLVIRRYLNRIYYCKIKDHPERKELVYFERELEADPITTGRVDSRLPG